MQRIDDIHSTQRIASAADAFLKALGARFRDESFRQLFHAKSLRGAYWNALHRALTLYTTPETASLARALMRGEVLADPAINDELLRRFLLDEPPDYELVAARWATTLDGTIALERLAAEAERLFDLLLAELHRQGELRIAVQRLGRRRRLGDADTTITAQQDLGQLLDTALTSGPRTLVLQVRHMRTLSEQVEPAAAGLTAERLLALAGLAAYLSVDTLRAVWDTAEALPDAALRLRILAQIAPHLSAAGLVENPLDLVLAAAADEAISPDLRADTLLGLVPRLGVISRDGLLPSFQQRALDGALTIDDDASRVRALGALIEHLPPDLQSEAVQRLLEAAARVPNDMARATALSGLPPHLPPEFQGRLLSLAFDLREPDARALLLGRMIPSLPGTLQTAALAAALDAVERVGGDDARADALIGLAPAIGAVAPLQQTAQGLQQAMAVLFAIERDDERAKAFAALAPYLPPDLLGEALQAVRSIGSEPERGQTLARLAPHLPGELQLEAYAAAYELTQPQARAAALSAIAPYLAPEAREEALVGAIEAGLAVADPYERVLSLVELTPYLADELRAEALAAAVEAVRQMPDQGERSRALVFLAPHLNEDLLDPALSEALAIRDPLERVRALGALMPHLTPGAREHVARKVIGWARAVRPAHQRSSLLAALAPVLPDSLLSEAVAVAERIETPYDRLHVLAALLPRDPERLRERALEAAQEIPNRYQRVNALLELVPRTAAAPRSPILDQALSTALGIEDDYDRASALAQLAPYVGTQPTERGRQQDVLQAALDACLAVPDLGMRASLLVRLAGLWVSLLTPGQSYRLWRRLVMVLRTCGEAEVLATLAALSPVLEHMGAPSAAAELARAAGGRIFGD